MTRRVERAEVDGVMVLTAAESSPVARGSFRKQLKEAIARHREQKWEEECSRRGGERGSGQPQGTRPYELRRFCQELAGLVQFGDSLRDETQQFLEAVGAGLPVNLVVVGHH